MSNYPIVQRRCAALSALIHFLLFVSILIHTIVYQTSSKYKNYADSCPDCVKDQVVIVVMLSFHFVVWTIHIITRSCIALDIKLSAKSENSDLLTCLGVNCLFSTVFYGLIVASRGGIILPTNELEYYIFAEFCFACVFIALFCAAAISVGFYFCLNRYILPCCNFPLKQRWLELLDDNYHEPGVLIIVDQCPEGLTDCSICVEPFLNSPNTTRLSKIVACNHIFHTECIEKWFISHKTCPLCRINVEIV